MIEKNIDWDNLGFNAYKTKSMFKAHYTPTIGWQAEGLIPYGDVTLSPASTILNYGQGIFEGTKAYKTSKSRVVFFRLEAVSYTHLPSPRDYAASRMPSSA